MFLQDYKILRHKEYSPQILRIAKIAKQKSKINSKAKSEQNQRQIVQPPILKLKRKAGAPKGNRNALKTGIYTGEMRCLISRARLVIAECKIAAAQVRLQATLMDMETRAKLRAAGPALAPLPELPQLARV